MMLPEIPDNLCVADQLPEVAVDQDEIEMVCAIGFLGQSKFAFEADRIRAP